MSETLVFTDFIAFAYTITFFLGESDFVTKEHGEGEGRNFRGKVSGGHLGVYPNFKSWEGRRDFRESVNNEVK